ncbi:T9SS type A sorting domain-containing protein [Ekhidna sp.]|uniref:T9SS type A sorting domain-containing protein n=1 Tax=Ekhidna sp. TaxID=2608089 RepID=UPI003CCBD51A
MNTTRLNIPYARILALLALCLFNLTLIGQTTYYSRNGATAPRNWDEADSWTLNADGSGAAAAIPGPTDNVVILNGHNIIVNATTDNGGAGTSADGLGQANVGTFAGSGTANFYHTGNIYIRSGGTFTTSRAMLAGNLTVYGTLTANNDLIILGRMEVTANATTTIGDDLILSGFSETLIYNTSTSSDDLYLDHTDALLCGDNSVNLGDQIQYLNGASSDQICTDITVDENGTPTSGTGSNTIGTEQNMLNRGATWRYLDDGSNQGTAWQASGFDDTGWSSGNAELGYGDGDEATTVSFGGDANNKYTTTYFRTSFYVEDRSNFTKILANVKYDDGFVMYINGNEVLRDNMPTGTISSSTFASGTVGEEDIYHEYTLSVFDVSNGTNYIAVEIHQANLTSSDISFDMELVGSFSNELIGKGETWNYLDDGTDQGTAWTGTSFDDSGWSSGDAELGYGDGDEVTTVGFGGDANNKYVTTYFRKSFSNSEASPYALKVGLKRDDGAIVYLNGNEIIRDNMPAGTVTYTTLASNAEGEPEEQTYYTFEVDPSDLVVGTNYIAVEIHQANVTSSDISFDLYLEFVQAGALLPVTLLDFSGEPEGNTITLDWSTATEKNNDYFVIERSADGKAFTELARIPGSGDSDEVIHYTISDYQPLRGANFYRLSQFDYDGTTERLKTIRIDSNPTDLQSVSVYPNPASDKVKIVMSGSSAPEHVELFDLAGNKHKIQLNNKNGIIQLDLGSLMPGIYVLKVSNGSDTWSRMITKK